MLFLTSCCKVNRSLCLRWYPLTFPLLKSLTTSPELPHVRGLFIRFQFCNHFCHRLSWNMEPLESPRVEQVGGILNRGEDTDGERTDDEIVDFPSESFISQHTGTSQTDGQKTALGYIWDREEMTRSIFVHVSPSHIHRQLEKPGCTLCFRGMPSLLLHLLGGGLLASLSTYDVNFVHRLLYHIFFLYFSQFYIDDIFDIPLHWTLEALPYPLFEFPLIKPDGGGASVWDHSGIS